MDCRVASLLAMTIEKWLRWRCASCNDERVGSVRSCNDERIGSVRSCNDVREDGLGSDERGGWSGVLRTGLWIASVCATDVALLAS